jgi:Putative Ig domain
MASRLERAIAPSKSLMVRTTSQPRSARPPSLHERLACLTLIASFALLLSSCGGGGNGAPPPPPPPSNLSYSGPASLVVGTATNLTPTVVGTATMWSVTPALPAGLSLNSATGVVAGTPSIASAPANYTFIASNAGGSTTAVVQLSAALSAADAASADGAKFLAGYDVSNQTVTLSWIPSFPSASGYQVERQDTGGAWTVLTVVPGGQSTLRATTWTSGAIESATIFRVEAVLAGYLVPLQSVGLQPQIQVVPPAMPPNLVLGGPQPVVAPTPLSVMGGASVIQADYFLDSIPVATSKQVPTFTVALDPAVTSGGAHKLTARLYLNTEFYIVVQQSVQTAPEILVSTSFTALTGSVFAVVGASSDFGITQVVASFDGHALGMLASPNVCVVGQRGTFVISSCNGGPPTAYAFAVDATASGSGAHTLVVQVTDGNAVVATITSQVIFDNPPILSTSIGDGAIVYGALVLSGSVSSDKSGAVTTTATLDGVQILKTTGSSISVTYSLAALAPGNYPLVVTSVDPTGNSTVVAETITVASSSNLVYTPVMSLGADTRLLAVDQGTFLYAPPDGTFHLHSGASDTVLQNATYSPVLLQQWRISDGHAFAVGYNSQVPNVLLWSPAGDQSNLSALVPPAAFDESLVTAHDGYALWAREPQSTAAIAWGAYYFYDLASGQVVPVQLPASAFSVGPTDVDFYRTPGGLTLYYWAWTSTTQDTEDVYRWDQSTGLSTRITADGLTQVFTQTDGVRVAWREAPASPWNQDPCLFTAGCTQLIEYDIASGVRQSLSQTLQNFYLADGLLAWKEYSTTGGGIKVSDGVATTTLSSRLSSQLLGVSRGYVLYADNSQLFVWSAGTGAQLLFDATPALAEISGKVVYFTNGQSQALYQVTLN